VTGSTAVVLVAAGRGERLGGTRPKAFQRVAGEPLIVHAARRLVGAPAVGLLVAVVPANLVGEADSLLASLPSHSRELRLMVAAGGATRTDSVAAGLAVLREIDDTHGVDVVLVHDAARAFVPTALVQAVDDAVRSGPVAVVPGLPVADTIKEVRVDLPQGGIVVTGTPDRERLRAIQTPQGFRRDVLEAAHRQGGGTVSGTPSGAGTGPSATDDAALVERLGHEVHVIPGDEAALKITTPRDLLLVEAMVARGDIDVSGHGPLRVPADMPTDAPADVPDLGEGADR
jgi:2-C-methyl-D-erythritol 4-phosphate cytidylyltransferase